MDRQDTQEVVTERIDTTIGELVEAISQIAYEAGKTEEEGYRLAALTLEKLLREKGKQISFEEAN